MKSIYVNLIIILFIFVFSHNLYTKNNKDSFKYYKNWNFYTSTGAQEFDADFIEHWVPEKYFEVRFEKGKIKKVIYYVLGQEQLTSKYFYHNNITKIKHYADNGQLKSIDLLKNGKITKKKYYRSDKTLDITSHFDEKQLVYKDEVYNDKKKLISYKTYERDNDGKILIEKYYLPDGTYRYYSKFFYTEENKLDEVKTYSPNDILLTIQKYANDKVKWLETFIYDENGKKIKTEITDGEGALLYRKIFNDDGLLESKISFSEDRKIYLFETFFYDDNKNLILKRYYNPNKILFETEEYTYNKDNLLIKYEKNERIQGKGEIKIVKDYYYDDKDRLLKYRVFSSYEDDEELGKDKYSYFNYRNIPISRNKFAKLNGKQ